MQVHRERPAQIKEADEARDFELWYVENWQ